MRGKCTWYVFKDMILLYYLSEASKAIECVFLLIFQVYKNAARGEKWPVTIGAKRAVTLGAKWADAFDI